MDKSKFYLDLSKCTEEERKNIFSLLPEPRDYWLFSISYKYSSLAYVQNETHGFEWVVCGNTAMDGHTELTYPEFIKLFDDGESDGWIKIESETDLPEQGGRYYITRFGKVETAVYLKNNRWLVDGNDYPKTTNIHCITHYQKIQEPLPPKF